jgi:hypothetical protein
MCCGYAVLEMLALDYEGKQQLLLLGALPLLVQHLQMLPHHPRLVFRFRVQGLGLRPLGATPPNVGSPPQGVEG